MPESPITQRYGLLSLILNLPSDAPATPTSQGAYIFLSMAIYLLSNHHVHPRNLLSSHEKLFRTLDSVFETMPLSHLQALLQSRLASIRAAFESLLIISGICEQRLVFKVMVDIGISNDWLAISAMGHNYLTYAASMNMVDSIQKLLDHGCHPDSIQMHKGNLPTTAIVRALERGNTQCAQLLLDRRDVNSPLDTSMPGWEHLTDFDLFVLNLHKDDNIFDDNIFEQGLELFVDAGANLTSSHVVSFKNPRSGLNLYCMWRSQYWESNPDGKPIRGRFWGCSVLDYFFYFRRPLYNKYAPDWYEALASQPTRAGVLLLLENGVQSLEEYVDKLALKIDRGQLQEFLELLLAEQFIMCDLQGRKRETDLKAVRALVNFGVSIDKLLFHLPNLLDEYTDRMPQAYNDCEFEALKYLLDNGVTVSNGALSNAAKRRDTRLFDLLAQNTIDLPRKGGAALIAAASTNNIETVKWLLDARVDVNMEMEQRYGSPISILACVFRDWASDEDPIDMVRLLVENGAYLRLSARKQHPYDLLEFILNRGPPMTGRSVLLKTVRFLVAAGGDLRDSSYSSASLLEACAKSRFVIDRFNFLVSRRDIFEYLFRHGAQLGPGSLAAWIGIGGGIGLVREMLAKGADVNACFRCRHPFDSQIHYWTPLQAAAEKHEEETVALLLQEGADVNAPAKGKLGRTALQASCQYFSHSRSSQEQLRAMRTVRLLLDHGAHVNSAPARRGGMTALQAVAVNGSIELAISLLFRNPPADVNAPSAQKIQSSDGGVSWGRTALDFAAEYGRMDMVKLLLNANALSQHRGETGYDGAIEIAQLNGHLAVAGLIREHATNDERLGIKNPYLSQPLRDWHEYGYDSDSD